MGDLHRVLIVAAVGGVLATAVQCAEPSSGTPQLVLRTGHSQLIEGITFSPDKKLLATLGTDGRLIVWDLVAQQELTRLTIAQTFVDPAPLTFSPDSASIFWTEGPTVKRNVFRGAIQSETIAQGSSLAKAITVSGDGKSIATGFDDGSVLLSSLASPHTAPRKVMQINGRITCLVFNSRGDVLAAGTDKGALAQYSLTTASRLDDMSLARLEDLVFRKDGTLLGVGAKTAADVTAGSPLEFKYKLTVWNFNTHKPLNGAQDLVAVRARFGLLGNTLLADVFDTDGRLVLNSYDVALDAIGRPARLADNFNRFYDFNLTSDGQLTAWVSNATGFAVFDLKISYQWPPLFGPIESVTRVWAGREPPVLFTGMQNGVALWDLVDGVQGPRFPSVGSFGLSPDGSWLAINSPPSHVNLISLFRRESSLPPFTMNGSASYLLGVSNTGRRLFWAASEQLSTPVGTLPDVIFYTQDVVQDHSPTKLCRDGEFGHKFAFSSSGRFIASVCRTGQGVFRDLVIASSDTFREVARSPIPASSDPIMARAVDAITFSSDDKSVIFSVGSDVRIVDVTGQAAMAGAFSTIGSRESKRRIVSAALHGRSELLVLSEPVFVNVGAEPARIEIWDWRTPKLLRTIKSPTSPFTALDTNEQGIFAGSSDGSVYFFSHGSVNWRVRLIPVPSFGWLVVAPDGLFDGLVPAMKYVAWRDQKGAPSIPMDAFFNEFYTPGLLGEVLSGGNPTANVNIAAAVQIPGLSAMLARGEAKAQIRGGGIAVCFKEIPGVPLNVAVSDARVDVPPAYGYSRGPNAGCPYEKVLHVERGSPENLLRSLNKYRIEPEKTPWDGKLSVTRNSTLHVQTIGISDYGEQSGRQPLPWAATSAKSIESFYRKQQGGVGKPYAAVKVWDGLYNGDATSARIRQRLLGEIAQQAQPDDVLVIYFAGHGLVVPGSEMFYFMPSDVRKDHLDQTGISAAMLAEDLRFLPFRKVLLIIDSCQAGSSVDALQKIANVRAQSEKNRVRLQGVGQGQEAGVGIHIVSATLPLSYAVGSPDGRSVFAEAFLQILQESADGITTNRLEEMLKDRLPDMSAQPNGGFKQVPLTFATGFDFLVSFN